MNLVDIKRAIELSNKLVKDKVIESYAIGGAMGVICWTEPFFTRDLDLFLRIPYSKDILVYLKQQGYKTKKQHVVIGTVDVDFVDVYNDLTSEALDQAVPFMIDGVKTRVFTPEYLLAIAIETRRPQDAYKMSKLKNEAKINKKKFNAIIKRHGLWDIFNAERL